MKLGECKWLAVSIDAEGTEHSSVTNVASDYKGHKWCTVQSLDGVLFQINYNPDKGDYQVNTHWYATGKMASRDEYSATFWISSTLELAAFLQDKQPT